MTAAIVLFTAGVALAAEEPELGAVLVGLGWLALAAATRGAR